MNPVFLEHIYPTPALRVKESQ